MWYLWYCNLSWATICMYVYVFMRCFLSCDCILKCIFVLTKVVNKLLLPPPPPPPPPPPLPLPLPLHQQWTLKLLLFCIPVLFAIHLSYPNSNSEITNVIVCHHYIHDMMTQIDVVNHVLSVYNHCMLPFNHRLTGLFELGVYENVREHFSKANMPYLLTEIS